jgi:hypothetical protein
MSTAEAMSLTDLDALLRKAIVQKRKISFMYKGHSRTAEPHDYGVRKGDTIPKVNCYQTGGKSESGQLPDWRTFLLREISDLKILDEPFPGTRAVPTNKHVEWEVIFASVTLKPGIQKPKR